MRSKGPLLFLVMALVMAAVAAWGAQRWMQAKAARVAASRLPVASVVVAATDLPAGAMLKASQLKVQHWPRSLVPPGAFAKPGLLSGRVLKTSLGKGEIVLASKLAPRGALGGLSAVVPEGFRAMTVRVDEVIGVGGFVQPGDRVDVLLTFSKGLFRQDPVTRTVLQDVEVLTVGHRVIGASKDKKARRRKVQVATLKLRPEQAERLALAALEGKVLLALRNHADHRELASTGIRLTALLPPPVKVEPAPVRPAPVATPPPRRPSVEVIKGTKRSQQDL